MYNLLAKIKISNFRFFRSFMFIKLTLNLHLLFKLCFFNLFYFYVVLSYLTNNRNRGRFVEGGKEPTTRRPILYEHLAIFDCLIFIKFLF